MNQLWNGIRWLMAAWLIGFGDGRSAVIGGLVSIALGMIVLFAGR